MQVSQLVGVSHHIDCNDFFAFDFERSRLQFAIGLQCYETGQSVDEAGTNKFARPTKPGTVTVPHPKKDLGKGLVRAIRKQPGLR
jgi:hypothetical protein